MFFLCRAPTHFFIFVSQSFSPLASLSLLISFSMSFKSLKRAWLPLPLVSSFLRHLVISNELTLIRINLPLYILILLFVFSRSTLDSLREVFLSYPMPFHFLKPFLTALLVLRKLSFPLDPSSFNIAFQSPLVPFSIVTQTEFNILFSLFCAVFPERSRLLLSLQSPPLFPFFGCPPLIN